MTGLALYPHQQDLVDEFARGANPSAVLLRAPVGVGRSTALAAVALERARAGDLVLLVAPSALIAQWIEQFAASLDEPVVIRTPSDVRLLVEEPGWAWPDNGIILMSMSALRAPVVQKVLEPLRPSLAVIDEGRGHLGASISDSLATLAQRADRVLVAGGSDEGQWLDSPEIRSWHGPLRSADGEVLGPAVNARVVDYPSLKKEVDLAHAARRLLARMRAPVSMLGQTRPSMQAAMLTVVRRLESPEQLPLMEEDGQRELPFDAGWYRSVERELVENCWDLLDQLDDLPDDPRLTAVESEVARATSEGRPVMVVAERVAEIEYLAAALDGKVQVILSVTGSTTQPERSDRMRKLVTGAVVIATAAALGGVPPLPDGTMAILYATPRDDENVRNWLPLSPTAKGIEAVLLKASPSMTPRDDLVEEIAAGLGRHH